MVLTFTGSLNDFRRLASTAVTLAIQYKVKKSFLGYVEDCDLPACATCGGETRTCTRTCLNGVFGDPTCPADQETKEEVCNTQACRKFNTCIITSKIDTFKLLSTLAFHKLLAKCSRSLP